MALPWYKICDSNDTSLEQGDFIENCPIVIPPNIIEVGDEPDIEVQDINSIILSQSCDLEHGKITLVLVCPYMNLQEWLNCLKEDRNGTRKARKKTVDDLKKGALPGYHLLNKDSDCNVHDYVVVDFKNVYGVNYGLVRSLAEKSAGQRTRLLSPYKEHLSQAFARYFMRVGLPNDIRIEDEYF